MYLNDISIQDVFFFFKGALAAIHASGTVIISKGHLQ